MNKDAQKQVDSDAMLTLVVSLNSELANLHQVSWSLPTKPNLRAGEDTNAVNVRIARRMIGYESDTSEEMIEDEFLTANSKFQGVRKPYVHPGEGKEGLKV